MTDLDPRDPMLRRSALALAANVVGLLVAAGTAGLLPFGWVGKLTGAAVAFLAAGNTCYSLLTRRCTRCGERRPQADEACPWCAPGRPGNGAVGSVNPDRRPLTVPLSVQFCPDCPFGLLFWHSWVAIVCDRCGAAYRMRGRFDGARVFAFVCQLAVGAVGVLGIASGVLFLQILSGAIMLFSVSGLIYTVLPRDPWDRNALARWTSGASLKPTPAHLAERSGAVMAVGLRDGEPHGMMIPSGHGSTLAERVLGNPCPACDQALVCEDGGILRCDACGRTWTTWTTAPLLSWSDRP